MLKTVTISATQAEIAGAFTEWDRRYREEPERFMSEAHRLLKETPETYGDACAPYFIDILEQTGSPIALPPVVPKPHATPTSLTERFTMLGHGCFRDNLQGLEFTPTLNPDSPASQPKCIELATRCTLLGGGWDLADDPRQLGNLVSYDHHNPATYPELAADTRADYVYWTKKPKASSSGDAWYVYFRLGLVYWNYSVHGGFARGVRRVAVASPSQ